MTVTRYLLIILTACLFLGLLAGCAPAVPGLEKTAVARMAAWVTGTEIPDAEDREAPILVSTQDVVDAVSNTPTPEAMPTSTPTPHSVLPAVDPAVLHGASISFWHTWSGQAEDVLDDLVEQFNASNEWGIQVEAESQDNPDTLFTRVQDALQSDDPPDLVVGFPYQALDWDAQHELVDLAAYLDDPAWGLAQGEQSDFYPVFWDQAVIPPDSSNSPEGKRLGVPAMGSGQLLLYNQSWAKELGFESPPSTPEELRQQACRAAQANKQDEDSTNDNTGGLILSTHYSPVLGWIAGFGGQALKTGAASSQASPYAFDTPEVREAFAYLRNLYDQGCAWYSEPSYPEQDFARRRGLFATGSITTLPYLESLVAQEGKGDQWTVIPFPSPSGEPAISAYGPSIAMFSSDPQHQLAAWLFLRWMLSAENQARLAGANSTFPTRISSLEYLQEYKNAHPQWAAALEALPYAQAEPGLRSWKTVRWALSDAATQLFRSYFEIGQVPELVRFLQRTANELDASVGEQE
jgi:ABC-type glycerol-3-phosphate transport system substrate-binding protein